MQSLLRFACNRYHRRITITESVNVLCGKSVRKGVGIRKYKVKNRIILEGV